MKLLDLYCGGGGAAFGINSLGIEVIGVDKEPQSYYPYPIIVADVLEFTSQANWWQGYDFIWASPPCQAYSRAAQTWAVNRKRPDLVAVTRSRLLDSKLPYCIENVPGAPLNRDAIRLCGEMFGIGVVRHRMFEVNWFCPEPTHVPHKRAVSVPNRKWKKSAYCSVAGHGGDGSSYKLADWQQAMGIDWIHNRDILTQAVPPAYSRYILSQFIQFRQNQESHLLLQDQAKTQIHLLRES